MTDGALTILYHHRTASQDGQAVHIDAIIAALRGDGHRVHVVAPRLRAKEFGRSSGILAALRRIIPRPVMELAELFYNIPDYLALRRAQKRHQPDCLYERANLFTLSGLWLKKRTGLPFLLEVNAPLSAERAKHSGLTLSALARRLEETVWRGADVVLPVSHALGQFIAQAAPGTKICVNPNGVDASLFRPPSPDEKAEAKAKFGLEDKTILGFSGFVRPWHGLGTVVEALADPRLAKAHLLIVGDGPGIAPLRTLAETLGVQDRMTVTGVMQRADIVAAMYSFDVALQAAVTSYASPLKLFEYMAMGHAIIAPDASNIREILTHEENSWLFKIDDKADFKNALFALYEDADLRHKLGATARRSIIKAPHSWQSRAHVITGHCKRLNTRPAD